MPLVAAVLLLLLAAVPAAAQDGKTVARHGEVRLIVHDDRDRRSLCVNIRFGDDEVAGTCGTPATRRMSAQLVSADMSGRSFMGGGVPAGTAEVELEFTRGERVRARTVSGEAYTGRYAGKLAFFLAETTGAQRTPDAEGEEDEPVLIRRFDAEGRLIGAASGGHEGAPLGGPQSLLRARGLEVAATATRRFAPSVLQLDRTETMVCLQIRHRRGGGSGQCTGPGPALPGLAVAAGRHCGQGTLVEGFAAAGATWVELTLGDDRRRRAPTYDVSALGTAARAVAVVVPPGQAVRSARALDAAGRVIETHTLQSAPASRRCSGESNGWVAFGSAAPSSPSSGEPGQVAAGSAAGPQLMARDDGDQLCLGIGSLTSGEHDCVVPPPENDFPQMLTYATSGYSAVGGLVPVGVESVRFVFEGGRSVTAEISDGGAYSGRYRGHVRFYLAHTGPGREVVAMQTFDGAGKLLSSLPGPSHPRSTRRTVARGPGYRLMAARFDVRFKFPGESVQRSRGTCFSIAFSDRLPEDSECYPVGAGMAGGGVTCSPRRGVLTGRLTKGLRGARFDLAGGGSIASRTIHVPKRFGGGRLWVLEIPSRARVTRLRYVGRLPKQRFGRHQPRSRAYPLPEPRRQCGYALDFTF